MNQLFLLGMAAFVFSSAVSAQTSTAFVRFRPAEAGFAGSSSQASSTFSDGKTRRWDFDWNRPLFATVPPVFGGVNVVNSATSESGSFLRLHDNQPVDWPHAPLLHLFSHAGITTEGVATVNNVTMLFLWKKEHFPGFGASDVASFDTNGSLSVNIPGWAQWSGHQPAEIRFLIRNGGQYYVSEARMPGSTGGLLTLTNFVLNPSNRWAPVTLTATSFQLPAILNFAPQTFGNVEAVGWIGEGSRAYGTNFSCASFDATGVRTTSSMAIGQNVNAVASYGTSHPFVDVMKMTSPWRTRSTLPNSPWDSERASQIPLDEFGWPTVIPFTASDNSTHTVHTAMVVQVPGSYRLRFEGQGEIRLTYNTETARAVRRLVTTNPNQNTSESRQAGGSVGGVRFFDTEPINIVTGEYDFEVHIVRSDANDPIRKIELIPKGFANADVKANPLLPDFVATLQGFRTLRMMDWNRTNNSPVANWAGRTRPTDAFQSTPNGVALEYMILLCNAVGADMWICLPHRAGTDRDYVTKAARVLRHGAKSNGEPFDPVVDAPSLRAWPPLNSSLKVMVEYSNETWNWMFSQATFCLERALAERAAGLPYSPVDDVARHQFLSVQSARVWGWFDEVFGNEARTRLVRVLASQSANPGIVSQPRLEAFQNTALVGSTQTPDTLAIAPYFGNAIAPDMFVKGTVATKTMESIFEDLRTEIHGPLKAVVGQQKALADAHGVWLTCYESGQHLVGANGAQTDPRNPTANLLTAKLIAANRDARMGPIYTEYLDMLAGQGIVEMVNFEHISPYSNHGSWGILESLNQPRETAPKFGPLMNRVANSQAVNHPPALELSHPAEIVDTDGNGLERVTLSAAGSVDYEGRVTAYRWTLPGLSGSTATITPTLPLGRTQGTVMVTDERGLAIEGPFSLLVRPQGSNTPMLTASFVSANATEYPGVVAGKTPWTKSSFLASGVVFEGWSWVPRTGQIGIQSGDTVTNALGVLLFHNAGATPSTVAQAITGNQYLSCTIRPAAGRTIDLRGAEVTWTLRSLSQHAARSTALLTSVGGFTEAAAIHRVEGFAHGSAANPRPQTFTAQIPVEPAYQNISGPVELRIYLWGNLYTGHATHLTEFRMTGRVR